MSELCCKICFTTYTEDVPPRILSCGHSCCSNCLAQILDTSKHCHLCRKVLNHSDVGQYPINYSLLEIGEELQSSRYFITNFRRRLEKVNEKHEQILFQAESSVTRILAKMDAVEAMKANESRLLEMMALEDDALNVKEANITLNLIEQLMKDVGEVFVGESSSKSEVDFQRSHYESSMDFLSKLRRKISQGEKYVAILEQERGPRYADLSVWRDSLKIHAFHPLGFEKKEGIKTVCYDDIKKCIEETGVFTAFFDFNLLKSTFRHKMFVELFDTPFRTSFLQMCSGECGKKAFKGTKVVGFGEYCKLDHNDNSRVLFHLDHDDAGIRHILKYYNAMGKLCYSYSDTFCACVLLLDNNFSFVKFEEKCYMNSIIGKVVHEETEMNFVNNSTASPDECVGFDNIIIDCGLSVTINH